MPGGFGMFAAALAGVLVGGVAVALATGQFGPDPDRARVEAIVRDYVLAHPEILPEAMRRLQERDVAKTIAANRAAYVTPFGSAWAGAKDADVVLVEFFDYACPYCRASNKDVERLLKEDPKLKVVWRELPVLGPDSVAASHVSLAAALKGKFRAFHDKLFSLGRPSEANVAAAAKEVGLDPAEIANMKNLPDLQTEIETNYELARGVNASGTPTFVIGDKAYSGAVGYDVLKQAIAEARKG